MCDILWHISTTFTWQHNLVIFCISDIIWSMCGTTHTILLSLASSGAGTTKPTENLLWTLWTGASGTDSSSLLGRPKLVVDFRRHRQPKIQATKIETLTSTSTCEFTWTINWTGPITLQRPVRKVRPASICWGSSGLLDWWGLRKRLNGLITKSSSILGCPLDPVQVVGESRMMDKLSLLLVKQSHPLQDTVTALGSSFSW